MARNCLLLLAGLGVLVLALVIGSGVSLLASAPVPAPRPASPSSPAASTQDSDKGHYVADEVEEQQATARPLVDALVRIKAMRDEDLEIETDVSRRPGYAGHHVYARHAFKKGDTVLRLPGRAQLSAAAADRTLVEGLGVLVQHSASEQVRRTLASSRHYRSVTQPVDKDAIVDEDLVDLHLLLLSLLAERRKGPRSPLAPWISALPPMRHVVMHHGLFVLREEYEACLSPRMQSLVEGMRRDLLLLRNVTGELCLARVPNMDSAIMRAQAQASPAALAALPAPAKALLGARFLTCNVTVEELEWAFAIVTARAHTIHGARVVFPLVDFMPYQVAAAVAPGGARGNDQGQLVEFAFVAGRDIGADEPLTFRTDTIDPAQVVLTQGFFESEIATGARWPIAISFPADADGPDAPCATDAAATSLSANGTASRLMMLCAELHIIRSAVTAVSNNTAPLDAVLEAYAARFADAPPAEGEGSELLATLPADPTSPALTPAGVVDEARALIREAITATQEMHQNERCSSKDTASQRPFIAEVVAFNEHVAAILKAAALRVGL